MNPADEVAAKKEPTEGPSPGAVAGSDDREQPRVSLEELLGPSPLPKPVNRRGSGGFARFLLAICIGVAATLAWQSYGEATKQIIATRVPELGWSPGAKQMIVSWVQRLGWTKPPAGSEKQVAPAAQTAPENVEPKAPSLDPEQVQQITQRLALLQQTVEQLAAGQDQMKPEIAKIEYALVEMLVKIPQLAPQPPAAPARKPTPTAPQSSRGPTPPHLPPHQ